MVVQPSFVGCCYQVNWHILLAVIVSIFLIDFYVFQIVNFNTISLYMKFISISSCK